MSHGPGESRFVEPKRHFEKPIPISDLVLLDRERCILCARCTRFSDEISGDPLIEFKERGNLTQVLTFPDEPFSSYFSGNTVQICPVGALTAKPYRFRARPWDLEAVESVSLVDAVHSKVSIQASQNQVLRINGVDNAPTNQGWLSDKDRFVFEYLSSPGAAHRPVDQAGGRARGGDLGGRDRRGRRAAPHHPRRRRRRPRRGAGDQRGGLSLGQVPPHRRRHPAHRRPARRRDRSRVARRARPPGGDRRPGTGEGDPGVGRRPQRGAAGAVPAGTPRRHRARRHPRRGPPPPHRAARRRHPHRHLPAGGRPRGPAQARCRAAATWRAPGPPSTKVRWWSSSAGPRPPRTHASPRAWSPSQPGSPPADRSRCGSCRWSGEPTSTARSTWGCPRACSPAGWPSTTKRQPPLSKRPGAGPWPAARAGTPPGSSRGSPPGSSRCCCCTVPTRCGSTPTPGWSVPPWRPPGSWSPSTSSSPTPRSHADVVLPVEGFAESEGTVTNLEGRVQKVNRLLTGPGQTRSTVGVLDDLASALGVEFAASSPEAVAKEMVTVAPRLPGDLVGRPRLGRRPPGDRRPHIRGRAALPSCPGRPRPHRRRGALRPPPRPGALRRRCPHPDVAAARRLGARALRCDEPARRRRPGMRPGRPGSGGRGPRFDHRAARHRRHSRRGGGVHPRQPRRHRRPGRPGLGADHSCSGGERTMRTVGGVAEL